MRVEFMSHYTSLYLSDLSSCQVLDDQSACHRALHDEL